MFQKLRDFFERVAFAGLKPDAPAGPKKSKLQELVQSAEELAARGLKADESALPGPTSKKKIIAIVVGLLVVAGAVGALVMVLQRTAHKAEVQTKAGPPPPLVPPNFKAEKNKDLAVEEIDFNKTKDPKEITGTLRNLTDKTLDTCNVSFDVTTRQGGQLGGVATTVHNLAPHGTAHFRIEVPQPGAAFTMVRELRAE